MNPLTNCKIISTNTDSRVYVRNGIERGKPDYPMSRGELVEFDKCPSRWLAGYKSEPSTATDWGSIIDAMALGGFQERFAVTPETYIGKEGIKPWNWNANACKEWRDAQGGKEVVKFDTHQEALKAWSALDKGIIKHLLGVSDRQVMVIGEYKDETGIVVPIKGLIDAAPTILMKGYAGCLIDLKTCASAAIGPWTKAVFEHSYHWQAAMYLDLYNAATGEQRTDFLHILQESYAPWQTAKRLLSSEFIELGRMSYIRALKRYCRCLKSGTWPDYDSEAMNINGWTIIEPTAWMVTP